ncbi:hypothetical protein PQ462_10915 [Flavobacterium sp. KACC 22758]|jgi:hypothetical protein|uniref:hypothetical protein n=1 Tax=Flavobacterium sp. KACC 22758 TaxID=3025667 RepID=UPI002366319F|nr:hypothetical protein [Flavobacterium sp. KACC 22758]WDF61877.1 hypothetical protein PQ462_10915 [Flavobacterium sp. KACC 22758]
MKKLQFTLFCIIIVFSIQAQTLNPTYNIVSPGAADAFKGGYTFSYSSAGTPWNGSLISYGGASNGYDTQISSDYGANRISFRTRNGDYNYWNPWNELVTSLGDNYLAGNQNIGGTLSIGVYQSTSSFSVGNNHGVKMSVGNSAWSNTSIIVTGYTVDTGDFTDLKVPGYLSNSASVRILRDGNVGIGVIRPTNKLDVNGTVHSKEVKVDMTGWSDFVFKREYKLPTLEEVEKHIAEKGYLENIPSEKEVLENGINLGEMNAKLLQKIEELTLYMIEMKNANEAQKELLEEQDQRLFNLEQKINQLSKSK